MGFGISLTSSTHYEALGAGTGTGTTVTASGSANTKGSYATLGTAGFDYDGFSVYIAGTSGNAAANLVDIAINNGGSDQVIAENLFQTDASSVSNAIIRTGVQIPVFIPKGASVKARVQSSQASVAVSVHLVGWQGDCFQLRGFRKLACCTDFTNSDPTNSITLSGTTLTGYTQIRSSTAEQTAGLYFIVDSKAGAITTAHSLWDVAKGGAGSETVIVPKIGVYMLASSFSIMGPYPVDIPAGTRLAVRAQCDAADTNVVSAVLYGLVP